MFTTEVLDGPVTTNKKAHDIIVGVFPFLRSDSKLSRFWLSEEKRKRFIYQYVTMSIYLFRIFKFLVKHNYYCLSNSDKYCSIWVLRGTRSLSITWSTRSGCI